MKIIKALVLSVLVFLLLACAGLALYLNHDALLARRRIDGIGNDAVALEDLSFPASAKVIALGEAAHGIAEFQELRLSLLQRLVSQGYTAFALELDYGDGLLLNDYIQGDSGNGAELVKQLSTPICRTEHTLQLIEWMRSYNATAPEFSRLRFYGFDMQNGQASAARLIDYCQSQGLPGLDAALRDIEPLTGSAGLDQSRAGQIKQRLEEISSVLEEGGREFDQEREWAIQAACALRQAMGSFEIQGEDAYYRYRDRCMADNVQWALAMEEKLGGGKLLIAAHNGHIARLGPSGSANMGSFLSQELGASYYAIGTDFFTASVNISTSSMMSRSYERNNHRFCSADPLAYQAKYMPGGSYYLDFSSVDEGSPELHRQLHSETHMASIGEGYLWIWYLFPNQYRPAQIPAALYDGMIYFYRCRPIQLLE